MGFDVPFILLFVVVGTVTTVVLARGVLRLLSIQDPPTDTPGA